MNILITAFEPFGGDAINESQEILQLLSIEDPNINLQKIVLPVSFTKSSEILTKNIETFKPQIIISLGLAANRTEITYERVAINIMDARIPDNDGYQPIDLPCVPNADTAYFSTLPIKQMIAASNSVAPSKISESAGTYVCNHVMFIALYHAKQNIKAGFIHVPKKEIISIQLATQAIQSAINIAIKN